MRSRCGRRASQSGNGREQPAPVADRRDADVLEVIRRQLRQDGRVNLVVSKALRVLAEAETAKPHADIHCALHGRHSAPCLAHQAALPSIAVAAADRRSTLPSALRGTTSTAHSRSGAL